MIRLALPMVSVLERRRVRKNRRVRGVAGKGSAAMPTRRRSLAGLMAVAGAVLAAVRAAPAISPRRPSPPAAGRPASARDDARNRPGQGRSRFTAVGRGNAGIAGQAMRNAAEMALAEFNAPNIQLLVKDDGGTGDGARLAAQQALDEGAEIILGQLLRSRSASSDRSRVRAIFPSSPSRPTPTWRRAASIC